MVQGQAIEIWIDALDECAEYEVRKMVSFFEDLADLADNRDIDLKICFASRHYPSVTSRKGVDVVLELQQDHEKDLSRYIEAKLDIGPAQMEEVKVELIRKCSGIFLWVVLVVDMLNREYAMGRVLTLRKRLDEIPSDLHAVYEKVLTNDEGDSDDIVIVFQLLLGANQPLQPAELLAAFQRAKEPQTPLQLWDAEKPPMSSEALQRWVNSSSRGLAEVVRLRSDFGCRPSIDVWFPVVVQFIHESVRDYLLGKSANKYAWSGLPKLRAYEQICSKVCMDHILAVDLSIPDNPLDVSQCPFLDYALRSMYFHSSYAFPSEPTEHAETERGWVLAHTYSRLPWYEYLMQSTWYRTLSLERISYLERSIKHWDSERDNLQRHVEEKVMELGYTELTQRLVSSLNKRELASGLLRDIDKIKAIRGRGEFWEYLQNTSHDPGVIIRCVRNKELPNPCTTEDREVLLRLFPALGDPLFILQLR